MENVKPGNILKTYLTGVSELGLFSMGVYLLETIFGLNTSESQKKNVASSVAEQLKNGFPVFYEFVHQNLAPQLITNSLTSNLKTFSEHYKSFDNIVVVGIEAVVLDFLISSMPQTSFHLIPHYDPIDEERVISNFPRNVRIIDIRDVTCFHKGRNALLSYCYFCTPYGNAFVYPATIRVIGADVKSLFMDTVGLSLLNFYTVYPRSLTSIPAVNQFFTKEYRLL